MALLRPVKNQPGQFEAVDESGRVVAVGTLEVEIIPGAQRHGSLQFITNVDWDARDAQQQALVRRGIAA